MCVSSARTDLCGGCRATGIPTAISRLFSRLQSRAEARLTQAEACATTDAQMPDKGGTGFLACVEMYRLKSRPEARLQG